MFGGFGNSIAEVGLYLCSFAFCVAFQLCGVEIWWVCWVCLGLGGF